MLPVAPGNFDLIQNSPKPPNFFQRLTGYIRTRNPLYKETEIDEVVRAISLRVYYWINQSFAETIRKNIYLQRLNLEIIHQDCEPDLSPLEKLTRLSVLILKSNCVVNLNPLRQLSASLKELELDIAFQIIDISDLADLDKLTHLSLKCHQMSQTHLLGNLVNLEVLHINCFELNEIVFLKSLTLLKKVSCVLKRSLLTQQYQELEDIKKSNPQLVIEIS